jgi:hypothetical protein
LLAAKVTATVGENKQTIIRQKTQVAVYVKVKGKKGEKKMAANRVAMRAAFQRYGFTAGAATRITENQGIDLVLQLGLLRNNDVENVRFYVLRRPGGTIPNPNAAEAGQPAVIHDPGIQVSLWAKTNLKLTCFWL